MRRYVIAFALLAVFGFAGCSANAGESTKDAPAAAGEVTAAPMASQAHNSNDVMFLQMMIVHIGQGRELAALAEQRSTRDDVKNLATAIDATEDEEAKVMTTWLKGWDEPTQTSHDPNMHADHGGLPALGPDQLAEIKQAAGVAFDKMFLNLLIGHQHNAVEMTNLIEDGTNPETKDLARRIKESRTDQISLMLTMASA